MFPPIRVDTGGLWEVFMRTITRKLYCKVYPYKRGFPTELDARLSFLHIKDDSKREKIPARVYKCDDCPWYHITAEKVSKENENETRNKDGTKERNAARIRKIAEASTQNKSPGN